MRETLQLKNGHLCIRFECDADSEPIKTILFWNIRPCTESEAEGLHFPIGAQMVHSGWGTYYVAGPNLDTRLYRLINGGSTQPIATEKLSIPQPKSRGKEMRFHHGNWERKMKSGWKVA